MVGTSATRSPAAARPATAARRSATVRTMGNAGSDMARGDLVGRMARVQMPAGRAERRVDESGAAGVSWRPGAGGRF